MKSINKKINFRLKTEAAIEKTAVISRLFNNIMKTTEDWLKEKVLEYKQNPKEALEDMLATTNNVMKQYQNNIESIAAKGVFNACIEHNSLFLIEIGVIDAD